MKLGFLGIGTISDAVIRAICTSDLNIKNIIVSPRNMHIVKKLTRDFPKIKVAKNNQEVLTYSEIIFIALRSQVAEDILRSLIFYKSQKVVTFIPSTSCATMSDWIGCSSTIFRAVPLPFIRQHAIVTPIFPFDAVLQKIFSKTGGALIIDEEKKINLFMTSASLMGVYFRFIEICNEWLQKQGLEVQESAVYLSKLFYCLAEQAMQKSLPNFSLLQKEYSTHGGTNELLAKIFEEKNGKSALNTALDITLEYITNLY